MNLPEFSIKKPITIFMITLIVILFGVVSLTYLPIELYPNTSFGQISIIIQVRGGIPPTEVEAMVTRPIEEAVATVSDLETLLSISKEGESTVVLSFKPETDMNFAALEVREKFAKVKNKLPKDIEKPVIAQFQQGDVPVFILALTSEKRTTEDLRKIVDQKMKENIKRVAGVANVEIAGGRERKLLIEADQTRLAAYGIPLDELTGALGGNNLNLLSGEVKREQDRFLVRVIGEFGSVDEIRQLPIRRDLDGTAIRVKDVAQVKDSFLESTEYSRLNTRPVVTLYVQKESTKNTIKVAKELSLEIERLKDKLPKDIHLVVTSNQAETIEKHINNLQDSLFEGIILIILVFFLFLYRLTPKSLFGVFLMAALTIFFKPFLGYLSSLGLDPRIADMLHKSVLYVFFLLLLSVLIVRKKYRAIIIVTLPIPVSVIGTFIFMRQWGLTINVMTLFGLALGVGMLIDNSIVVFENILKKKEGGEEIVKAAVSGSSEMFLTIVASTITTVIVFLPLVFMGDELKKLFSGMAATIVMSLLVSMVCAVTLVPVMCSKRAFAHFENSSEKDNHKGFLGRFASMERQFLFRTIRYRWLVFAACVAVFMLSCFFMSKLGKEYLGSTEQSKFTAFVEMPTGTKLDVSDKVVKKVESIIRKIPEVKNVSSRIEPWSSKIYVELVESLKRRRTTNDVIEALRQETDKLQPAFVHFQQEEQVGTKEVVIEIFGYSYERLRELAMAVANHMGNIKGLTDTKIRMREGRPEMQVTIDKKKAGYYRLNTQETANQIHGQMRGFRASVYHTEGTEVEMITRLDEKYRKTFKDLSRLIMTNKGGDGILLGQISDFKFGLGPSEVWRKDKSRMIQVTANIGKVPLGKVAELIKDSFKDIPFNEDYFYRIGGDYPTLIATNKQLKLMISLVLVLVYLVLASLFESKAQPILIMVAVSLALVGAVIALYIGPKSIGVGAMLGMMMLGGIVVNNSIMLVDRINFYIQNTRRSPIHAAVLANRDRLRPILMTTSTTLLGLVPMALDQTEGANLWSPLAQTVIGGVFSSTLLTLLVTPAFYIMYKDIESFFSKALSFFNIFNQILVVKRKKVTSV